MPTATGWWRAKTMPLVAAILFGLSALYVGYILFGYPVLLAWLARHRSRPFRKEWRPRTVSVLLAVHNGERWMEAKLQSLLDLDYPPDLVEILVLSDGSTDGTEEIARRFVGSRVRLLALPRGGKASALNAGMAQAKGEILFFTDVRQRLSRDSLRQLVSCFADPSVGAASGELIILSGETQEEYNTGLYWRYEKWIRRRLSAIDSILGATGCIYAMRRELAAPLPPDTLLDDIHLPLAAFFRGYRAVLDGSAKAFDYPTSLRSEFRRKIRTQAGTYQIVRHYPALLGPRNRMWLHFASHRLGRLLLPFALLTLAGTSFAAPFAWAAVPAQALFYGLALADPAIPDGFPLKRVTAPVRTFVVLMAAALCAVTIFFVPSRQLWKQSQAAGKPA